MVRVCTKSMMYEGTIKSLDEHELVLQTRKGGLTGSQAQYARIPVARIRRVAPMKEQS